MLAAAFDLDPLSLALRADCGLPSCFGRIYPEAVERFREAAAFGADFWYAH